MKIVSGDVGGTKTRLAIFAAEAGRLDKRADRAFPSPSYGSLEEVVQAFLGAEDVAGAVACFGVAGPVRDGRSQITNLPWVVDARRMASALGLRHVWLLNDLEASAHGIDALAPEDLLILHPGVADAAGNAALIAAGTGLGEAGLYWDGRRHRPFASEGGHATFAPTTDLETALHAHLRARFGHVSWERILSGPGLVHLYTFLRAHRRAGEPAWLTEEMAAGDAAAAITRAGLDGRSPVCSEALDLFVTLYGREAGNLALKLMATGGVYVGGGIAPRIQARLRGPAFVDAFRAKGRMASLLEAIPVRVILQDAAPLLGAARYAAMAAGGETP